MAIRSTLSILGLYNYDNDIFHYLEVPEGMDRDIVINDILAECADLEILYPAANLVKELIKNWVKAELHIWTRLYNDTKVEYNPVWNVDANEKEIIERELDTSGSSKGQSIDQVSGYNSEEWKNSGKSNGNSEAQGNEKEIITNTKIRGGNIGVTKSSELLLDDWNVWQELNAYQIIVKSFKNRFCIEVY